MRDKITHTNSLGETIDFSASRIYIEQNDLRDFEWKVVSKNERITGMTKGIVKKTIPFVISVDSARANEVKNMFFEHFEKDILRKAQGFFEINGYKLYGYVTKSVKSSYLIHKRCLKLTIEYTCDNPYWIKETTTSYIGAERDIRTNIVGVARVGYATLTGEELSHYPYGYSYGYGSFANINHVLVNNHYDESDFIIIINGKAKNPIIDIDNQRYELNYEIMENEYVIINSSEKTITLYKNDGSKVNIYNYRNKKEYIFTKIPSGEHSVRWNGNFDFSMTLIGKRSEPEWI